MKKLFTVVAVLVWPEGPCVKKVTIKTTIKAFSAVHAHEIFVDKYVEKQHKVKIKSMCITTVIPCENNTQHSSLYEEIITKPAKRLVKALLNIEV